MRMRLFIAVTAMTLAGLTACGSDTNDTVKSEAAAESNESAASTEEDAFCAKFDAANTKEGEASRLDSSTPEFEESLKDVVEAYEDISGIAPAEIKPKIDEFIADIKEAQASAEPVRLTHIWGDYMTDFADFITSNCF